MSSVDCFTWLFQLPRFVQTLSAHFSSADLLPPHPAAVAAKTAVRAKSATTSPTLSRSFDVCGARMPAAAPGRAGPRTGSPKLEPSPLSLDLRRSDQPDGDQIRSVDPLVGERHSAGLGDFVAKRDRPAMLDQGDRRGRPFGNRVAQVPNGMVVEEMAVLELCSSRDRTALDAFLSLGAEPDQSANDRAELLRFVLVEIALLNHLDLSVIVLLHQEEVDQACNVVFLEPGELLADLAGEFRVVEADDDHLHRAEGQSLFCMCRDAHRPCKIFCFWTSNSASVSTPWSCSCPSFWS